MLSNIPIFLTMKKNNYKNTNAKFFVAYPLMLIGFIIILLQNLKYSIYVCAHTHTHTHTHTHIHIYIYIYIYTHTWWVCGRLNAV